MVDVTVVKAVSGPLAQGVFAGVWSASRGMSPGRRRLVRAGALAVAAAVATADAIREQRAKKAEEQAGDDQPVLDELPEFDTEQLKAEFRKSFRESTAKYRADPVLGVTAIIASSAVFLLRRRLEKRWLHDLHRHGHPHPHRATAIRVAALTVAGNIPSAILDLREARAKG